MLLSQANVGVLKGCPWAALELTSDIRLEEVMLHLVRWCRRRPRQPIQIFFPVKKRGLHGIELLYPAILIRAKSLAGLKGVSSIMGVQGLAETGDVIGLGDVIGIDDFFVTGVILEAEKAAKEWSAGIRKGSFVRILYGPERMLCGKVTKIVDEKAEIVVSLQSRKVRVKVPVVALENLGMEIREYFYDGH